MAKEKGLNVLVKIGNGAGTEVFTALAGQDNATLDLSADRVDTSDKTTDGWGSSIAGNKTGTVTVSGKCSWPDTAGLDRLRTQFAADATVNCQFILNSAGDKWSGAMAITSLKIDGDAKDVTKYSVTLANAGALTYSAGA